MKCELESAVEVDTLVAAAREAVVATEGGNRKIAFKVVTCFILRVKLSKIREDILKITFVTLRHLVHLYEFFS